MHAHRMAVGEVRRHRRCAPIVGGTTCLLSIDIPLVARPALGAVDVVVMVVVVDVSVAIQRRVGTTTNGTAGFVGGGGINNTATEWERWHEVIARIQVLLLPLVMVWFGRHRRHWRRERQVSWDVGRRPRDVGGQAEEAVFGGVAARGATGSLSGGAVPHARHVVLQDALCVLFPVVHRRCDESAKRHCSHRWHEFTRRRCAWHWRVGLVIRQLWNKKQHLNISSRPSSLGILHYNTGLISSDHLDTALLSGLNQWPVVRWMVRQWSEQVTLALPSSWAVVLSPQTLTEFTSKQTAWGYPPCPLSTHPLSAHSTINWPGPVMQTKTNTLQGDVTALMNIKARWKGRPPALVMWPAGALGIQSHVWLPAPPCPTSLPQGVSLPDSYIMQWPFTLLDLTLLQT